MTLEEILSQIKFDAQGLVPAIVQDAVQLDVLMMAWMDKEALKGPLLVEKWSFGVAVVKNIGTRAIPVEM